MWLSIKLLWLHWYGNVCKRKGSSRVAAVSRDLQCIMTAGRCRRPPQHNAIYTAAATARESQPHVEGVIWLVNGVTIAHYQSVIFRSAWITAPTGLLNIGCRANLSCAAVLSGGTQSNPWLSPVFSPQLRGEHIFFLRKEIFHLFFSWQPFEYLYGLNFMLDLDLTIESGKGKQRWNLLLGTISGAEK